MEKLTIKKATEKHLKDVNELTILAKPFVNADASSEFNKIKMELSLIKDNYNKLATRNAVPFKKAFEETNLTLTLSPKL